MNQGPRRISLTKKNGGKKSRETIPLRDEGGGIIFKRRQKMLILGIHPSRDFYERFSKLLLYVF
jgi:hypothetical protein